METSSAVIGVTKETTSSPLTADVIRTSWEDFNFFNSHFAGSVAGGHFEKRSRHQDAGGTVFNENIKSEKQHFLFVIKDRSAGNRRDTHMPSPPETSADTQYSHITCHMHTPTGEELI